MNTKHTPGPQELARLLERGITVAEYASFLGASLSTARRILERDVSIGYLAKRYRYESVQYDRASHGLRQPPAHKIAVYRKP